MPLAGHTLRLPGYPLKVLASKTPGRLLVTQANQTNSAIGKTTGTKNAVEIILRRLR